MSFEDKIKSPKDMKHLEGEVPVNFLYTVGTAGEKFFREIKESAKILGIRCERCGLVYVPPRIYCERCFERLDDWLEVGNEGRVETFTICYFDADGNKLAKPQIMAVVKLKGAHGGIIHRIQEADGQDIRVGMNVKVVFKGSKDRAGSILDIAYFKP